MSAVIDYEVQQDANEEDLEEKLFQVWIDLNFGESAPDWWWNSEPQLLGDALDEAAAVRADGWVAIVTPAGENPRDDGRWDNP